MTRVLACPSDRARSEIASPAVLAGDRCPRGFGVRWQSGSAHQRWARVFSLLFMLLQLTGCQWLREACNRPTVHAQKLADQARAAESAGNAGQATALLREALALDEDGEGLHREMARLMQAQGNRPAAIKHWQLATEQNPDDVEGLVQLAELFLQNGSKLQAVAALDTALGSDPNHVTALLMRSRLANQVHDNESALAALHQLLSREPGHVEARLMVADLLLKTQRPEQAAPLLRGVCQSPRATDDQIAAASWTLGIAYGQESRWQDAVTELARAADMLGSKVSADDWYRLAYARTQTGDIAGSQADVRRALRVNPQHQQARAMEKYLRVQDSSSSDGVIRIGHTNAPPWPPAGW